jgi:hypothetical protein
MIATANHVEEDEAEALSYQVALRAVGGWLDSQRGATGIRIVELTDGLLVQYGSTDASESARSRTFSFDEIWDLNDEQKRRKRSRNRPESYQNVLRALGHELDEADGRSMLLEQVDGDLMLTYLYPHYVGGFALVKQFSSLTPETQLELVRSSQQRRTPGKLTRGLIRLIGAA